MKDWEKALVNQDAKIEELLETLGAEYRYCSDQKSEADSEMKDLKKAMDKLVMDNLETLESIKDGKKMTLKSGVKIGVVVSTKPSFEKGKYDAVLFEKAFPQCVERKVNDSIVKKLIETNSFVEDFKNHGVTLKTTKSFDISVVK